MQGLASLHSLITAHFSWTAFTKPEFSLILFQTHQSTASVLHQLNITHTSTDTEYYLYCFYFSFAFSLFFSFTFFCSLSQCYPYSFIQSHYSSPAFVSHSSSSCCCCVSLKRWLICLHANMQPPMFCNALIFCGLFCLFFLVSLLLIFSSFDAGLSVFWSKSLMGLQLRDCFRNLKCVLWPNLSDLVWTSDSLIK